MREQQLLGVLQRAQTAQRASLGTFCFPQIGQQRLLGLFSKPQTGQRSSLSVF
jgi:hypothetical protein